MTVEIHPDIETEARTAYADSIYSRLDGGTIEIRSGSPPASIEDPDSGTLLAEFTLFNPAFTFAGGIATIDLPNPAVVWAAGTAGHFRAKTSDGDPVLQGTAGVAAGSPDLTLTTATIGA